MLNEARVSQDPSGRFLTMCWNCSTVLARLLCLRQARPLDFFQLTTSLRTCWYIVGHWLDTL